MIVLKKTTDSLELVLGGSVTTNELDVMVSCDDVIGSANDENRELSNSNGTTPVAICQSPASGEQKLVDYITIYNNDTVNANVIIQYNDNGTIYIIKKETLAPNKTLEYSKNGWAVK